MSYPVKLTLDDGVYVASCRDIPEFNSVGKTEAEALRESVDGLETALQMYVDDRQPIPAPSAPRRGERIVYLPALAMAKLGLYRAMLDSGLRKADMVRRLKVHAPQIDRLLSLVHKSKLDQVENAIHALGFRMVVAVQMLEQNRPRASSSAAKRDNARA